MHESGSKPGGRTTTRCGHTARWGIGRRKSSPTEQPCSGRLRLPPRRYSARSQLGWCQKAPGELHYDWTRNGGQVSEVVVYVQADSRTNDDIQLHFTIADTGIGIPAEKQTAIFEAFTQAGGSMSRTYGGTGLGLTIWSRLVAFMGGRIWVESEPGKGSRFHFTAHFGLQKVPARTVVPRDPTTLRDMRVLVVDDNATNRQILLRMLANWHANPTAVESGARAITALREAQGLGSIFPLILLDAQMPEMDGFALAECIKRNPDWRAATIMMLSSAGQRGDARRCRELGVAAYLTKPVRQGELLDAILTALGTRPIKEALPVLVTRHSLRENSNHLRILLVEDNAVNQVLAVRLLEKRGHTVAVAGNGKEALAALEKQSFDLVLMDVQMPEAQFEARPRGPHHLDAFGDVHRSRRLPARPRRAHPRHRDLRQPRRQALARWRHGDRRRLLCARQRGADGRAAAQGQITSGPRVSLIRWRVFLFIILPRRSDNGPEMRDLRQGAALRQHHQPREQRAAAPLEPEPPPRPGAH